MLIYTPLKKRTSLATLIGAAWRLFPRHRMGRGYRNNLPAGVRALRDRVPLADAAFPAIAWLYREDYSRAGIPLLPVPSPTDGARDSRRFFTPPRCGRELPTGARGHRGRPYIIVATVLGFGLIALSALFARERTAGRHVTCFCARSRICPPLGALVIDRV